MIALMSPAPAVHVDASDPGFIDSSTWQSVGSVTMGVVNGFSIWICDM